MSKTVRYHNNENMPNECRGHEVCVVLRRDGSLDVYGYIGIVDQTDKSLRHVEFDWDDSHGNCYDCGLPAAYSLDDEPLPSALLCSVCAADHASTGEIIYRLDDDA